MGKQKEKPEVSHQAKQLAVDWSYLRAACGALDADEKKELLEALVRLKELGA